MPRSERFSPAEPRKTSRRWTVMPPLVRGAEAFLGERILEEVRGPLGMLFWVLHRDVFLLLSMAGDRSGVFGTEADGDRRRLLAEIKADAKGETHWTEILSDLIARLAQPAHADVRVVADLCQSISKAARARGWLQTSLGFVQQAALADPESADLALGVATLAHQSQDDVRAEVWYRRTVALARAQGDWRAYAEAFQGLATLYQERNDSVTAKVFRGRALKKAERHHMHDLLGGLTED